MSSESWLTLGMLSQVICTAPDQGNITSLVLNVLFALTQINVVVLKHKRKGYIERGGIGEMES